METEIWKDIEGYEGIYQVSNLGRVRSLDRVIYRDTKDGVVPQPIAGKMRKAVQIKGGYMAVHLYQDGKDKGFMLHRLVADAFVPGYKKGYFINHKDENKANNRADNLEWCTTQYNNNYGTRLNRLGSTRKSNGILGRYVEQLTEDFCHIATYNSISNAARATGSDKSAIMRCCKGRQETSVGYRWRYVNNQNNNNNE